MLGFNIKVERTVQSYKSRTELISKSIILLLVPLCLLSVLILILKTIGRSVTKNCTDTTENHAVPSRQIIVEDKKFSGISALEMTSIQ